MKHIILLLAASLAFHTAALGQTTVPRLMNYQGHVVDGTGAAIGAGDSVQRTVIFRFYTAVIGGTRLWSESQQTSIVDGDFNVLLGNGTPVSGESNAAATFDGVFADADVFLGVTVDNGDGDLTNDAEISPRQQMVTTAYAFRATVAETVDSLAITSSMLAGGAVTTNQLGSSAVTSEKIANSAVTSAQIADGSIGGVDLANESITSDKILNGTITAADLGSNSVTSAKIQDGTIALADLAQELKNLLVPVGTIQAFGGAPDKVPTGWLLCDGGPKLRNEYPALFAVIGTNWGNPGGGSDQFNVPELRGTFLRGVSGNSSRDPYKAGRSANLPGGNTGNAVGSYQEDAIQDHTHNYQKATASNAAQSTGNSNASKVTISTVATGSVDSATNAKQETRPKNAYVHFIIKY
jgi:microcystin-dependent protein